MTVNPEEHFSNHFAFLVGIDEYTDPRFGQLTGAYSDAEAMRDVLCSVGYTEENVWLVPPEETFLQGLNDQVEAFILRVRGDRQKHSNPHVVVFWAGHGVFVNTGSLLIVRSTEYDFERLPFQAMSLDRLVRFFDEVGTGSLTLFFDVCHSVRRDLALPDPRRVFAPLHVGVERERWWAFVGVSTFAFEHEFSTPQQSGPVRWTGILTETLCKGISGEPCDPHDSEPCVDENCIVSVERLLPKLNRVVPRKAELLERAQRLYIDHSLNQPRLFDSSTPIGLSVQRHVEARLGDEGLPVDADLLAKAVVDRGWVRPWTDTVAVTPFGIGIAELVAKLVRFKLTKEEYLQEERTLVFRAILRLQADSDLGKHVKFVLSCRRRAEQDEAAKLVLAKVYDYLLTGGSTDGLARYLSGLYGTFSGRKVLPWSCGIRVLKGGDEWGYAPIIGEGKSLTFSTRRFVTTSQDQLRARLEPWKGDGTSSSIRDGRLECCDYSAFGRFTEPLQKGTRVWVTMGVDEHGCENCEIHDNDNGDYVPMKILLSRKRLSRESTDGHDWRGHWHLRLGGFEGLNGDDESPRPGPTPEWVAETEAAMEECLTWLELWPDEVRSQEEESAIVTWLYWADLATRMWDRSRLRDATVELLAWKRRNEERGVPQLLQALREVIGPQADAGAIVPDEEPAAASSREVSAAIADYEEWRDSQVAELHHDDVRRAGLLVALLRAVTADEADITEAADNVAETAEAEEVDAYAAADQLVAAMAVPVPLLARAVGRLLVVSIENFIEANKGYGIASGWAAVATQVLEGESANALGELISQMRASLGVAAWLLAKGFLDITGLSLGSSQEFDALVERLRHEEGEHGARDAAEDLYHALHQLSLVASRRGDPIAEEEISLLLVLHALIWPGSEPTVTRLITADIERMAALKFVDVLAGFEPRVPDVWDNIGQRQMLARAISDSVRKRLPFRFQRAFFNRTYRGEKAPSPAEDTPDYEPEGAGGGQDQPPGETAAPPGEQDGWHDPMLLAIPPHTGEAAESGARAG